MRHQKKKGRLNRRSSWRKATLQCLTKDLITYQRIETTMAKAKALRSFAEPIITLAKNNPESVSARRRAFAKLCDKTVVKSLFDDLAPLFKEVPGGYTRIMPLGNRKGDGAQMVIIELTKRTISDEKLLGLVKKEKKPVVKKKTKADAKTEESDDAKKPEDAHSAPEVDIEKKEERTVEDIRKEKARREQKKMSKKGGLFKRFRRKSIG
ncbi:MAG: 50S ribosomal protein L17 [Candidatus Tantalella remota]|nr:50S ribosomal protein L17 [Candidatus Tantalella remota]